MSDTYTKLFSSITESTVWEEPYSTRIAWVTLLAMADANGCVYSSVPGLARRANITRPEIDVALVSFLAPDRDSRTLEHEGRRIEAIDGGWRLLNHAKYSAVRNAEERREYWREWKRNKRAEEAKTNIEDVDCPQMSTISTASTPPTPTPTLEKKDQKKKQPQQAATFAIPEWIDPKIWDAFLEMRRKKRAPATAHACALVITELIKLRDQGHKPDDVLNQSIRNSWTDVYQIRVNVDAQTEKLRSGQQSQSKTMQGINALEAMKHENRKQESSATVVQRLDFAGPSKIAMSGA